jgi:hypothetical protein
MVNFGKQFYPDIEISQGIRRSARINPVTKENIYKVFFGVYPKTSSCKSQMPYGFCIRFAACWAIAGIFHIGFVKAEASPAVRAFR